MTDNCYHCRHNLTCYARIQTSRIAQTFKLFCDTEMEFKNTGRRGTVIGIFDAMAAACSVFEATDEKLSDWLTRIQEKKP